jgi:hypothetical protein
MNFDFKIDYWVITQTKKQNQVYFMFVRCLSVQKVQNLAEMKKAHQRGCLIYYPPLKYFTIVQKLIIHLISPQINYLFVVIVELINQKDLTDLKLGLH